MPSPQEQRIDELIKRGEEFLDIYLSSLGGQRNAEPWYSIFAAGIDLLTSLSLAAITTGPNVHASHKLMEDDMAFFFLQLLGQRDPAEKPYTYNIFSDDK